MKHTLAQAEAKALDILAENVQHGDKIKIETWETKRCPPEVGYRVAEISWTRGNGGSWLSQTHLEGLLICAAVERYVITLMTFDDEDQYENGFIEDAACDLQRLMDNGFIITFLPSEDEHDK